MVIHGIDYNHNGKYDFSAGKSDLDPSLPAEATDPAACGVLHESKGRCPRSDRIRLNDTTAGPRLDTGGRRPSGTVAKRVGRGDHLP